MSGFGRKLRGGILAAAVAGSLGFGTAEAFARPGTEVKAPPTCDPVRCNNYCVNRHGPFAHGECWGDECLCAI